MMKPYSAKQIIVFFVAAAVLLGAAIRCSNKNAPNAPPPKQYYVLHKSNIGDTLYYEVAPDSVTIKCYTRNVQGVRCDFFVDNMPFRENVFIKSIIFPDERVEYGLADKTHAR